MWLSRRLGELGINAVEHITIGDDIAAIAAAIMRLIDSGCRAVILTGGLGPTADDLTRDAIASVMREELITDDAALADLEAKFRSRGRKMSDIQRVQCTRPRSAAFMPNTMGTASQLTNCGEPTLLNAMSAITKARAREGKRSPAGTPLRVARDFLCMGEDVANQAAEALVLTRSFL